MKNKRLSIRNVLVAALLVTVVLHLATYIKLMSEPADFIRQFILSGALFVLVLIISRQNQDDDDWAY